MKNLHNGWRRITLNELYQPQDPAQFAGIGAGTIDIPASDHRDGARVGARPLPLRGAGREAGDEVAGVAGSDTNLQRLLRGA